MRTIAIFDTTLRDGEQSPGCSMNLQEKMEIARCLEVLGVDVVEAGFAASSPDDFAAVKHIANTAKGYTVASLARAVTGDIDAAWNALQGGEKPRIHIVLATSPIHMEYKLKMTPKEVLARAADMTAYARSLCADVEFSAEDATRSDRDFLRSVYEAVIEAGASTINVPDTVGYITPSEMEDLIRYLQTHVKHIDRAALSVHCHNDLGLAVANTLAAIKAGATQAECTLGGIGERAGNASLEEIVLALQTRSEWFGAETKVESRRIYRACKTLSSIIGVTPSPNKPIIGANAFAHEAGIHQHGVLSNPLTYEIMRPESIGIPKNIMVLGKHSGRHAFVDRLRELGYTLDTASLETAFAQFKDLADRKKVVSDADIIALISDKQLEISDGYQCLRFVVSSGSTIPATATVKLRKDDEEFEEASTGDGPINAAFNAIDRIACGTFTLTSYSLRSVTGGEDAQGEATVKLSQDGVVVTGRGLSTDVIEASIKAYLNGINKLGYRKTGMSIVNGQLTMDNGQSERETKDV